MKLQFLALLLVAAAAFLSVSAQEPTASDVEVSRDELSLEQIKLKDCDDDDDDDDDEDGCGGGGNLPPPPPSGGGGGGLIPPATPIPSGGGGSSSGGSSSRAMNRPVVVDGHTCVANDLVCSPQSPCCGGGTCQGVCKGGNPSLQPNAVGTGQFCTPGQGLPCQNGGQCLTSTFVGRNTCQNPKLAIQTCKASNAACMPGGIGANACCNQGQCIGGKCMYERPQQASIPNGQPCVAAQGQKPCSGGGACQSNGYQTVCTGGRPTQTNPNIPVPVNHQCQPNSPQKCSAGNECSQDKFGTYVCLKAPARMAEGAPCIAGQGRACDAGMSCLSNGPVMSAPTTMGAAPPALASCQRAPGTVPGAPACKGNGDLCTKTQYGQPSQCCNGGQCQQNQMTRQFQCSGVPNVMPQSVCLTQSMPCQMFKGSKPCCGNAQCFNGMCGAPTVPPQQCAKTNEQCGTTRCCTGQCKPDKFGNLVCAAPPAGAAGTGPAPVCMNRQCMPANPRSCCPGAQCMRSQYAPNSFTCQRAPGTAGRCIMNGQFCSPQNPQMRCCPGTQCMGSMCRPAQGQYSPPAGRGQYGPPAQGQFGATCAQPGSRCGPQSGVQCCRPHACVQSSVNYYHCV